MRNFADVLYRRRLEVDSNIILIMDSDFQELPDWLCQSKLNEFGRNWAAVSETVAVYERFLLETVAPHVAAIMPRLSSYMQYGAYGLRALECTIVNAIKLEVPVIIDARIAEYDEDRPLAGNSVIGHVSGWDGQQPSNMHAHAISIIPNSRERMIKSYVDLSQQMHRGLVVIPTEHIDWTMYNKLANSLIGEETSFSGLTVLLENQNIMLLESFEESSVTTFIRFPQIYDMLEMTQFWSEQSIKTKAKSFICLSKEISNAVDSNVPHLNIKDEDMVRNYFENCVEKVDLYKKIFNNKSGIKL